MSLEEAIERMESCAPKHWEGDYIVPRELSFLKQLVKEGSEMV
jgi:hypothetical protein